MRRRNAVCAASVSDLPFDARVWKEARSLVAAGYSLTLIGCRYDAAETARRHDEGVDVVEISLGSRQGGGSILSRVLVLLRVWAEVLRTPAAIYHAHNVEAAPAVWLAARLRRAPLVYDAHEIYAEASDPGLKSKVGGWINAALERFMMKQADAVITTNASRRRVFERNYGRMDIVVLGNVPQVVAELEPIDPGYPPDRPVLLYQGHISADGRAFRETLEALVELPDVHFTIIGFAREWRLELIREWARELGVEDRVQLLPPRPFDELVATAVPATIGLVPIYPSTLNNYLGDTNKIFEYLMAGLPVAAADLPEIRRVAMDGDPRVGELFDPYSAESVADSIRELLADPEVYARRREEARRLALEKYNWTIEERKLVGLYDRISGRVPSVERGERERVEAVA